MLDLVPVLFSFVRDPGISVATALDRWVKDIKGGLSPQALSEYLKLWDVVWPENELPSTFGGTLTPLHSRFTGEFGRREIPGLSIRSLTQWTVSLISLLMISYPGELRAALSVCVPVVSCSVLPVPPFDVCGVYNVSCVPPAAISLCSSCIATPFFLIKFGQ